MQDEVNGGEEVVEEETVDPDDPEVFDTSKPTSPNAPNAEETAQDTNPSHVEGETYEDYKARVPEGTTPASEAEWANAEVTSEEDVEDEDDEEDDEED